jgi:hypothetical protein
MSTRVDEPSREGEMRTRVEKRAELARAIVASDGRGHACVLDHHGFEQEQILAEQLAGPSPIPRGLNVWEGSPELVGHGVFVGTFRMPTSAEILSLLSGIPLSTSAALERLRADLEPAEKTGRRCRACGEPGHYAKSCPYAKEVEASPQSDPAPEEERERGSTRWVEDPRHDLAGG